MSGSKIVYDKSGRAVSFVGEDATRLYQAAALHSGLGLLMSGIKPNRAWTITNALAAATRFTGQHYKRSRAEIALARADLQVWIQNMKSALPTEVQS